MNLSLGRGPLAVLLSRTFRADDSSCELGRGFLTAHGFVPLTVAQGHLRAGTFQPAQHHLCHIAAVPVPRFLRDR